MSNTTLGYQTPSPADKNLAGQSLTRQDSTAQTNTTVIREEVTIGDPNSDFLVSVNGSGEMAVQDSGVIKLLSDILVELRMLNLIMMQSTKTNITHDDINSVEDIWR